MARGTPNPTTISIGPSRQSVPAPSPAASAPSRAAVTEARSTARAAVADVSAATPQIADPKAYKQALNVLKEAGKDKQVRQIKQEARQRRQEVFVTPSGATSSGQTIGPVQSGVVTTATGGTTATGDTTTSGVTYTQEELDEKIKQAKLGTYTAEDVTKALDERVGQLSSQYEDWKRQYQAMTPTAGETSTSASTSTSQDSYQPFDPNLFRGLLGELESSKYRQKLWNESSAKAAYKY